jgi:hypothetical protein
MTALAGKYTLHEVKSENGKRLGQLAARPNMVSKSTCIEHKRMHKGAWVSPSSDVVNQINHVVINKRHASSVTDFRSCRGPSCDSNHFLVKVSFISAVPCIVILFDYKQPTRRSFKQSLIYCVITVHVSGALCTHHQEHTKLQLQPLIQVIYWCDVDLKCVKKVSKVERLPHSVTAKLGLSFDNGIVR